MDNPTNRARRGRYRRRWIATGLLVGVPAIVVPSVLFAQEADQPTSARSGRVLDANSSSTPDGARVQQSAD